MSKIFNDCATKYYLKTSQERFPKKCSVMVSNDKFLSQHSKLFLSSKLHAACFLFFLALMCVCVYVVAYYRTA